MSGEQITDELALQAACAGKEFQRRTSEKDLVAASAEEEVGEADLEFLTPKKVAKMQKTRAKQDAKEKKAQDKAEKEQTKLEAKQVKAKVKEKAKQDAKEKNEAKKMAKKSISANPDADADAREEIGMMEEEQGQDVADEAPAAQKKPARRRRSSYKDKGLHFRRSVHTSQEVTCGGKLQKLGRNRRWQTRYFEGGGHYLRYYKDEKKTAVLAAIDMWTAQSVCDNECGDPLRFSIVIGEDETLHLRAKTKEEADEWVANLQKKKRWSAAGQDTWQEADTKPIKTASAATLEGFLTLSKHGKQGIAKKAKDCYWFVLQGTVLAYYKSQPRKSKGAVLQDRACAEEFIITPGCSVCKMQVRNGAICLPPAAASSFPLISCGSLSLSLTPLFFLSLLSPPPLSLSPPSLHMNMMIH
jgi:hypothetical protein